MIMFAKDKLNLTLSKKICLLAVASSFLLSKTAWEKNFCHAQQQHEVLPELVLHARRMIIRNPDELFKKVEKFRQDGPSKMLLISDFDYTLTKYVQNGERGMSSHGVLPSSKILSEEFNKGTRELYLKYFPIEISPTLSHKEKEIFMVEWWTKAHDLLIKEKIHHYQLQEAVNKVNIILRDGFHELFNRANQLKIPVLIFSAGLGDIIDEILKTKAPNIIAPNLHVISNRMKFDKDGVLEDFKGNLIHGYNKDAKAINGTSFWKECEKRKNILLIGDSIKDSEMANGIDYESIIRIGFLNDHVHERMDEYTEQYDIVVTGDGTLSPALLMLNSFFIQPTKNDQ